MTRAIAQAPSEASSLEVVNVRKNYPGVVALKGVSLAIRPGEVHALIGKNGAGKSTLVRILSGATQPTSGHVLIDGRPQTFRSPRDAFRQGIATVYQELSLIPQLTVAHNISLPELPTRYGGLCIDWPAVYERAQTILRELELDLDPHAPIRKLGVAQRQMAEIAKAAAFRPRVVLLDEPTSALADHETESLFGLVRRLTAGGVSIIYISHRMQELQRIADRVSVLRDGVLAGTIGVEAADPRTVAQMMFGETPPPRAATPTQSSGRIVLQARGLRTRRLHNVDIALHQGEILGLAGVLGSGRSELLRALSGADRLDAGQVAIDGEVVKKPTVARMKRLGVGMTPENRQADGLVLNRSTRDNACLASLGRFARWGIVSRSRQVAAVEANVRELQIAVPHIENPVIQLSGGNQQKVVVAKWLNTSPRVLLMDEPTRGIDMQAKRQIFDLIRDLSRKGISIMFVSSELEELVEICQRIAIMQCGRIVGSVRSEETTPQQLFEICSHFSPDEVHPAHA